MAKFRMSRLAVVLILFLLQAGASRGEVLLPTQVVHRASVLPKVDGVLSEDEWRDAAILEGFQPATNASGVSLAGKKTRVRLLWTPAFLYVAFECEDADVYCTGTLGNDAELYKEDVCEVFLDGVGDGRQFIELQVSPAGAHFDNLFVYSCEVESGEDGRILPHLIATQRWSFPEWSMKGLETAAGRTEDGWCAELAIPAPDIVKRKGEKQFSAGGTIRANFVRYDHEPAADGGRSLIQQSWVPVLLGNPHNSPARMGALRLLP